MITVLFNNGVFNSINRTKELFLGVTATHVHDLITSGFVMAACGCMVSAPGGKKNKNTVKVLSQDEIETAYLNIVMNNWIPEKK